MWLGDEGPGSRDPFAVLAGAALRTSKITLGVAVTNPYLRHPAVTAAVAMTIQELSGGRAVLGLGAGGDLSLGPAHIARDQPLLRLSEAIEIIRSVASAQRGDGYSPPPHAFSSPVPLFIGARGERLNRLASSQADGAFLGGIPLSMLEPTLAWVRSVRAIDVALYFNAVFDAAELDEIRPRLLHPFLDAPEIMQRTLGLDPEALRAAAHALHEGDDRSARSLMTDEILTDLVLVGRPAEVGRRLAELVRRYGPGHVGLSFLSASSDHHLAETQEAFAVLERELG